MANTLNSFAIYYNRKGAKTQRKNQRLKYFAPTTNRGGSWTKLTDTQFDRVTSITFNPLQQTQAYLTTETQGLWISNNMNTATPVWALVDNYDFRQPERVFFNPFDPTKIWVTSFGNGLKVGSTSGPLAVRLLSFNGSREGNLSKLQWVTANEDQGDVYELERSTDGINFIKISSVISNPGYENHYYQDDNIAGSALYYRVKIRSATAGIFYSNIILLKTINEMSGDIRLLQNPVTGNVINLQSTMGRLVSTSFILYDAAGKIVYRQTMDINAGISQLNIPVFANCAKGVYVLRIESADFKKNIRIMIMK